MMPSALSGDTADVTDQRPRKRAKYTQVACNECKRRKLKCSGGTRCSRCTRDQVPCVYNVIPKSAASPSVTGSPPEDRLTVQVHTVQKQIEALQREVQVLSTRLRGVESPCHPKTPALPSSVAAGSIHRILNAPHSPSYIGPTSAEFGLDRPRTSNEEFHDDSDRDPDRSEDYRASSSSVLQSLVPSNDNDPSASKDPLKGLSLEETLRLVQVYDDNVATIYPCVDLASVRMYVVESHHSRHSRDGDHSSPSPAARSASDWFHARDVQVLSILLATALLVESHGRSELAAQLADCVEDRFASRVKVAQVDMKEILILVLLSIFHSYRDDEVIAWRLIGMAARGSMELGLHRQATWQRTEGIFPGALEWLWASRLFWIVYVLDRKWSCGTGLPFAIQDADMDTDLPGPGHSTPYLNCMISYARLSSKIWGLIVGWSNRSRAATSEGCAMLDAQVQQWVRSIPRELRFDAGQRSTTRSEPTDRNMMLQVLLALQANQLRILVYRQYLLSSERIAEDLAGASIAVETAKSTIHMLEYFSRVSNIYFQRPEPFNYFLISALAALFLAVLHAPYRYSQTCRPEFYTAIDMVRRSATQTRTSRRLQKIIRSLKRIQLNVQWQKSRGPTSPGRHHQPTPSLGRMLPDMGDYPSSSLTNTSLATRSLLGTTPLSTATESPPSQRVPRRDQMQDDFSTPQRSSATLWPLSPATAIDPESNDCEDLSSFFEIAGGLYFDPGSDAHPASEAGIGMGMSHHDYGRVPHALDAFQAEDEALTRVVAGLL
ncbi:hypothetical protein PMG11_06210 [Penicillium brasilianum]|uniref:Zn(2)-C6 fungal-type domain-containing protein n=1 Tax=Penicillium brasilianum TaxID=104259 RepID=A0A0F7TLP2_PENBI|nr:hypothetical protein PMG11_06210 [Penicillium brasilianum]